MKIRYFSEIPKMYLRYPSILKDRLVQSFTKQVNDHVLPQVKYVIKDFYIEPKHLVEYNKVCGFDNNGNIPAIYFSVLSQTLQVCMMTEENFPLTVLSLVHTENEVIQHQYLPANQRYQLSCHFGQIQQNNDGIAFDFIIHTYIHDQLVMEGKTKYFYRPPNSNVAPNINLNFDLNFENKLTWDIPENIGRRYALVSGDFNLIHLHAFTAKAFGFNQAVAHGMWSKAKVMAQLNLPEKYTIDIKFEQPIDLPTTVQLKSAVDPLNQYHYFQLLNEKNDILHASGKWSELKA